LGQVSPNTWYEVNLISLITGDGTYSLRVSDSVGGADYSSKESTNAPKLLVAVAGATPQSCSGTATATPTSGATNTPTNTPTPGPSPTPTNTFTPTVAPTATPTAPAAFNNATFVYDGDGKRVKSTFNSTTTTYFVGNHYEVTGSTITKYYYAGAQRIAMRTNGTLNYLLGDHLGSTSLVTDSTGVKINEQRYKAWGETRYTFGSEKTKYQYMGQFSYTSDFGLYFYNARWYDPSLSRFAQADSIIPGGVQGYDRYAYVNNSPVRYSDPSGHIGCDEDTKGNCINYEYKKFDQSDILKTIIHIGFGSMVWARDGDGEPRMAAGFHNLGTAVVDRKTIVTADHTLQKTIEDYGGAPYMFMWGQDSELFIPIPMDQVTPNTSGDLLVLRLPDSVSVSQEFLVANSAINYTPKPLQPISVAYQDDQGATYVLNSRITLLSPVQTHVQYGTQYAGYDFLRVLNLGDSGGGVFYEGGLIGVNSAIAPYPGFNIQPISP